MSKTPQQIRAVRAELEALIKKNDVQEDTWWETDDDGNLLLFFEGDLHGVLWQTHPLTTTEGRKYAHAKVAFDEIVARQGFKYTFVDNISIRLFPREDDPFESAAS